MRSVASEASLNHRSSVAMAGCRCGRVLDTGRMRLPPRAARPSGDWGSSLLSQPAEWWEPNRVPGRSEALFLPGGTQAPSPRRPVAGSLPQAAEFNPRTALPRGDGKHLASCSGYKASLFEPRCCCRHSRPLSHRVNFPSAA